MIRYYELEPEVAGGWGAGTVVDRVQGKGTFVRKLHYVFDGWLGDQLLESSACYIVTESLAKKIEDAGLTGAHFEDVEVSKSDQFQELYPGRELPRFVWLKPVGLQEYDDFVPSRTQKLLVSERALELLVRVGISHAASVALVQE